MFIFPWLTWNYEYTSFGWTLNHYLKRYCYYNICLGKRRSKSLCILLFLIWLFNLVYCIAMWPGASSLTSQCFNFHIFKMRIIIILPYKVVMSVEWVNICKYNARYMSHSHILTVVINTMSPHNLETIGSPVEFVSICFYLLDS